MKIVLYRRNLSLTSGAGQLIRMQAEGLRGAGATVGVACQRGGFRFFCKTRLPVSRASAEDLRRFAASRQHLLVDHGLEAPEADFVFVHNLMTEGARYVGRADWVARGAEESVYFGKLRSDSSIVANSQLVRRALVEHFALHRDRIAVQYPGFDSTRFAASNRALASARARRALGIAAGVPVVGFVTSGDFQKRGLDIFLSSAERIAEGRSDVRFLVVGSKRLPDWAARHRLVANGRVVYRPKSTRPELWFAALDLFLYTARFEEFGMVVAEAQASGVPVLTSRRVGAAECLPIEYGPWLLDEPDAEAFAAKALALLDDEQARRRLAAAGAASVATFSREQYARASVEAFLARAREKSGRDLSPACS